MLSGSLYVSLSGWGLYSRTQGFGIGMEYSHSLAARRLSGWGSLHAWGRGPGILHGGAGASCMGVWVWLSPLEAGVPLRGEAGGSVEGLCEEVLAG